jgi:hypothetical protein
MIEHYSNVGNASNIKRDIWNKLNENPLLTPQEIAKLLELPYKQYRNYITKERSNWKYYHESERGSKCCESHHCRYRGKILPGEVNRGLALEYGWFLSKARNRFFVFKCGLGRIVWFETGKLRLFVKKPANEGKAKSLFCEGFFKNGLITDLKVLNDCVSRIEVKGAHSVFPSKQRLPYMVVDAFSDSHGILIKIGDRTHPNSVEVIWEVTKFQERIEEKIERKDNEILALKTDIRELVSGLKISMGDKSHPNAAEPVIEPKPLDRRFDYSC